MEQSLNNITYTTTELCHTADLLIDQSNNGETQLQTISQEPKLELKKQRLDQLKAEIDLALQDLIKDAASIRKNITSAKTDYKKQYFQKKFNKVKTSVHQTIVYLQQIEYLIKQTDEQISNQSIPSPRSDK